MVPFEPFDGFALVVRRTEEGTRQLSSVFADVGLCSITFYYLAVFIMIRLLRT
jgi:hypothetical protein